MKYLDILKMSLEDVFEHVKQSPDFELLINCNDDSPDLTPLLKLFEPLTIVGDVILTPMVKDDQVCFSCSFEINMAGHLVKVKIDGGWNITDKDNYHNFTQNILVPLKNSDLLKSLVYDGSEISNELGVSSGLIVRNIVKLTQIEVEDECPYGELSADKLLHLNNQILNAA